MATPSDSRPLVLVVDDNTGHVELLRAALASHYRVLTALNGLDGYTMACRTRPDALVLDLIMPVVDGYTVVQKLHANPATATIPIVVITGADASAVSDGRKPLDVSAVLRKPSTPGEIVAAVKRALSSRPAEKG